MLTPQQIAQAKAGPQPAASPIGGFTPEQAHQWISETPQAPEDNSYLGQVKQQYQQGIQHGAEGIQEIQKGGPEGGIVTGTEGAFKVMGGAANALLSPAAPAFNALNKGIEKVTTPITENPDVQKFAMSHDIPYERLASFAGDVGMTAGSLAGFKGPAKVGGGAPTGIGKVLEATKNIDKYAAEHQNEIIRNTADEYITHKFDKAIKPTITAKSNPGQYPRFKENVKAAVKSIVANKDNLQLLDHNGEKLEPKVAGGSSRLPETIGQFRQAIEQTKQNIFHQYDAMAKSAGDKGAIVAMKPIVQELQKVAGNKIVQDLHPDLANYAAERAKTLLTRWAYTTEEAQAAVQNLNRSLDAYFRNPSYETYSKASIDSLVANKLREGLDNVIENRGQAGYQALRNQYASLKAIEKDVIKREIVEARQTGGRGMNVGDIVSAEELIRGLATHNPAALITAGGIKAIQAFRRWQTDPNRAVMKMFEKADQAQSLDNPKPVPASPEGSYNGSVAPKEESVNPETVPKAGGAIPKSSQRGFIRNPFAKEEPNKVVQSHLTTTLQELQEIPPEKIEAMGGMKEVLNRLKINIVDGLKGEGKPQEAAAVRTIDPAQFKTPTEFADAANKAIQGGITRFFDIPKGQAPKTMRPTSQGDFSAYTASAMRGVKTPPNYFSPPAIPESAPKVGDKIYRGENATNKGGVHWTTDKAEAQRFAGEKGEVLEDRMPANIVDASDPEVQKVLKDSASIGRTTEEMYQALEQRGFDAILSKDPMTGKPSVLRVGKRTTERTIEGETGWEPGDRTKFDTAMFRKDAKTVKAMLPKVPREYQVKFSKEIKAVAPDAMLAKDTKPPIPDAWKSQRGMINPDAIFKGFEDLTTKLLNDLKGRATVSKTYLLDATNRPELKQPERDLFRHLLKDEKGTINVKDFADKVKTELLPLKRTGTGIGDFQDARYENITLPSELRGPIAAYTEHTYQSPIKTSAGGVHFSERENPNYFAHTRIEDLPNLENIRIADSGTQAERARLFKTREKLGNPDIGDTRRVIEIQSDLFQKGRVEGSIEGKLSYDDPRMAESVKKTGSFPSADDVKSKQVAQLEPYRNTWWERIVREEVKQAAKDGKTKLQFPTGETAMKIEGLVNRADKWVTLDNKEVNGTNIKDGDLITYQTHEGVPHEDRHFLITKNNGDGTFRAVDDLTMQNDQDFYKYLEKRGALDDGRVPRLQELKDVVGIDDQMMKHLDGLAENLSAQNTVDKSNPIYKFYEKDVGRYLSSKYKAKLVTDPQGVKWWELPVTKKHGIDPIEAFGAAALASQLSFPQDKPKDLKTSDIFLKNLLKRHADKSLAHLVTQRLGKSDEYEKNLDNKFMGMSERDRNFLGARLMGVQGGQMQDFINSLKDKGIFLVQSLIAPTAYAETEEERRKRLNLLQDTPPEFDVSGSPVAQQNLTGSSNFNPAPALTRISMPGPGGMLNLQFPSESPPDPGRPLSEYDAKDDFSAKLLGRIATIEEAVKTLPATSPDRKLLQDEAEIGREMLDKYNAGDAQDNYTQRFMFPKNSHLLFPDENPSGTLESPKMETLSPGTTNDNPYKPQQLSAPATGFQAPPKKSLAEMLGEGMVKGGEKPAADVNSLPKTPLTARTTFFAPGAGGRVEGPWATSRPNLEGLTNANGDPIPRTLDDVRLGKSKYVTLAVDPSNYGKFYNLGTLTYKSPLDGKEYTLENVVGYAHDTGSAFTGRPDKFDVAVGDFRGWNALQASQFVDAQPYGMNKLNPWNQITAPKQDILNALAVGAQPNVLQASQDPNIGPSPNKLSSISAEGGGLGITLDPKKKVTIDQLRLQDPGSASLWEQAMKNGGKSPTGAFDPRLVAGTTNALQEFQDKYGYLPGITSGVRDWGAGGHQRGEALDFGYPRFQDYKGGKDSPQILDFRQMLLNNGVAVYPEPNAAGGPHDHAEINLRNFPGMLAAIGPKTTTINGVNLQPLSLLPDYSGKTSSISGEELSPLSLLPTPPRTASAVSFPQGNMQQLSPEKSTTLMPYSENKVSELSPLGNAQMLPPNKTSEALPHEFPQPEDRTAQFSRDLGKYPEVNQKLTDAQQRSTFAGNFLKDYYGVDSTDKLPPPSIQDHPTVQAFREMLTRSELEAAQLSGDENRVQELMSKQTLERDAYRQEFEKSLEGMSGERIAQVINQQDKMLERQFGPEWKNIDLGKSTYTSPDGKIYPLTPTDKLMIGNALMLQEVRDQRDLPPSTQLADEGQPKTEMYGPRSDEYLPPKEPESLGNKLSSISKEIQKEAQVLEEQVKKGVTQLPRALEATKETIARAIGNTIPQAKSFLQNMPTNQFTSPLGMVSFLLPILQAFMQQPAASPAPTAQPTTGFQPPATTTPQFSQKDYAKEIEKFYNYLVGKKI